MSQSPCSADVAIIGAGVVGLALAFELGRGGLRVVVVERDRVGAGASGVAAGMLAPASEAETEDEALLDLALQSCALYPEFVQSVEEISGMSCQYRTEGTLLIALHRDHFEELEHLARRQASLGLTTRWLSPPEVLELEPSLTARVTGGLLAEGDRQVNPRALVAALAKAVERLGGTIVTAAVDISLKKDARGVNGLSYVRGGQRTEVCARQTVIAAGAFSNDLLAGLPRAPMPLRPVKGQILRLRGEPLIRHVIRTPDVYLVPRADGELVVGATAEEQGFDQRITADAVLRLLDNAWRVVPGIAELEVAEMGVGFRPALRDNLPVIGPGPTPRLYLATGHYRHGVMLAPITAHLLGETLRSGVVPAALMPFQLDRFRSQGREVAR